MITIKDTLGNVRFSTEINTGSRRKFSLMSEDYIVLKFSVEDPVYFKLGDYTDTELGLFELVDLYKPTLNDSTGAYDYELRLDAHYYKWKNKIFKFNPEVGGSEAGWKLTATLDVHLGVFLRNLSALGYTYKGTPFEVNIDSTVAKTSKLIVYDNTNLIDALTQMAETWECEWWVEDNQIRFGRCEFGDPVDFVINENVERMPREESKATFATRVYAFGSTRNIPNDYRPVDESVVVNGIVQKRLMMPTGVQYVDAYPDMTTEEAVEDVVIFDYIYPRRTGTMSSVTPVERTENVENEDGSTTQQKYTVYQFKDTGITFSKDYILPGEELRIVFQTGVMAGMDFAVTFNPDNLPEKLEDGSWNPQAQLWEIVRNEDYGRMLPADTLIPVNGDTYNLYGFDSTSPVFEDMIKRAEEELEEKAKEYVEKTKIDPNTYPCTMMSDYMYNDGNVRTNEFTVGARINLINPAYFENGRVSRVIGFEFDLDIPYSSPTFTIGETASYSRIGEIEDKVDELTYKGQVFTGTGSGVYVIGTNDNTPPTNKNVYSALKILREFVRYQGWVDQPVRKADAVEFKSVTSPLFIFNELTTPEFVSGLLGAGTRLKDNHLELDEITVRKRMNVFELLIQRVRAVGGQLLLSPASIKISTVEELENGYKCSFNTDDQTIPEPFVLNDQAFHQTFTGKGINRYWRLTTEAGDDYFVLSKTDCEPGSGIPQPGDEVILLGNRTDKARQSAMMLSAYGNDAPYLDTYDGINDYNLSGKLLTREGNLTGIVDEVFGQLSGSGFYGKNVYLRGKFALSSGVSVEDKFGQTDSQMNNLQGQLTNQQGQLNTQQGQITNIQTDILAIPGQIKQEVSQTVTYEVGNLQIGMVNLLKGSNVELNRQNYNVGRYYWDKIPETGKTYTLVVCYTLGTNNTYISAYSNVNTGSVIKNFSTHGDKVVESHTFTLSREFGDSIAFYQFPNDGTYGSKVHWAVLVEGNKGPNSWIPSQADNDAKAQAIAKAEAELAEVKANAYADGIVTEAEQNAINEAQARLDALKIGSVNLVSRKMMLDWNNKASGIATWGQDADGVYLDIDPGRLFYYVSTSSYNPVFTLTFKPNTQYVFSVEWKHANQSATENGLAFYIIYTDGTRDTVILSSDMKTKTRVDLISARGKTILRVSSGHGNATLHALIYAIAIYEGNKKLADVPPSFEDSVDNLQVGSVNLVSRKMMLAWNEKNKNIAVWGQDSDGIYLAINQGLLYTNVSGGTSRLDCFLGEGKYKANTQYVFSVEWKLAGAQTSNGVSFWAVYTDGTNDGIRLNGAQTSLIRESFITKKGKTVEKIFSSYGANTYRSLIYSLALYEGNKVLAEPPVATEDLTGQSNVNLLDNSKFQFGTEGYRSNQQATLSIVDGILQVRSSQTTSTPGVRLPIVHLKPGVYTIKTSTRGINIPSQIITVSTANVSSLIWISGNIPSLSTFTEKVLTFAISTEGDYRVLIMWDASIATTYPAGLDIEYSMLTAGEIASQGWSPSPGDVAKDIKDVSDAVSNLDATINTTFKDGIISEAEAKAIASNINVLNAEKADIDAYYNKLHANAYLTGTAKTNLASAKTAYNTAHTNLINSINKAIADGKATATEKADVDAKFSAYNNALSAYQTRVGEADKAIQDTIKKVADDAQASANTAQSAANAAQSTANQAQADANAANSKLTTWASDNYISPQEKTGLKQQKSDIQAEYNDIEANANRYNILLTSYSTAYNSAIAALNKYTATSPENIAVGSDYNNIAAYYPARQAILNSIAVAAKAQADKATGAIGMDGGKMLYADPEFKKGTNEIMRYGAQNNGGTVDLYRVSKSTGQDASNSFTTDVAAHVKEGAAGSPHNGSDWCLYIRAYGGTSSSHLGGFYFSTQSRANAVFIVKVSAKIPVGYTLKNGHNAHGTGSKQELLTSMAGTGKYETYIFKETCGPTGTFSTMNHLYLSGPVKPGNDPLDPDNAPLEWFVDYVTVFDMTADGYGDIVEIAKTETVAGINNNPDSVTVYAKKTDFNSLNQVVNQQGSQLQVNTNSIDAIVTKNGSGTIVSIKPEMVEITGATVIQDGNGNKVNIFGIGDKVISVNGGVFSVDKAGKVIMQNAEIAGKITAKTGEIGSFTIDGIWLKGSELRISGSQITFENGNNQVYLNSHPDMATGGAVKLGTFVLTGGSYNGLERARAVALIAAAPSDNYSCAIAVTSGRVLMKGQIHFDNVVTYTGSGAVTITADSGHFIYLTPITGNPVVSVSSGLPIGSWFIIAHATTAGGYYYIKLSGSDRFRRRNNAYQQVNSHNQDPSLIFKVNNTTWIIGNLPVNWIDWN